MAYITTITVSNDNDPACRTFTLSEEFNSAHAPTPAMVKEWCKDFFTFYRDACPQNHNLPIFLPTVVEIVPAQNREPVEV